MYRRRGWHGRGGRIERFQVAALLLLLREQPAHGYDLLERLPSVLGDGRVDVGNLYRVLRRLEEQGLVSSEWDESVPGPAKRTYELTAAGGEALERWAAALAETRSRIDRFLQRHNSTASLARATPAPDGKTPEEGR
jgi:poly-beta-hydroxybutyrate-responsive repressor